MNGLLAAATGTAPVQPGTWDRLLADLDGGDLTTVAAALVGAFAAVAAAVIAAGVAVRAYRTQQAEIRREQKATTSILCNGPDDYPLLTLMDEYVRDRG